MSYGQQLDIPFSNGKFFGISKHIPGRVMSDDFVYFNNLHNLDARKYSVYVSSNDMAGESFTRYIGPLTERVALPHVQNDAYAKIYVEPTNKDRRLPFYVSRLNRGSTYAIPKINTRGTHEMHMYGVLKAGAAF